MFCHKFLMVLSFNKISSEDMQNDNPAKTTATKLAKVTD